jgi:hypothetical protein
MRFTVISSTAAAVLVLGLGATAQASIIPIGSTLIFGGSNLPGACTNTSCSDTTTFGPATVLIDGGALSLSEQQVADGPNAEWDAWRLTTVGGGPLAGNINSFWNIVMSYTLSAPVFFDQVVTQWTVNGAPVNPLVNFSGICCATASNPSPISGESYYNSGFSGPLAAGVQSNWQQIFVNPYSFVSAGGVDPNTANGFNFALHFTLQNQTATPEPEYLPVVAGLLVAGFWYRRRLAHK